MTSCLLGKHLPKDTIQSSRWAKFTLSNAQWYYACIDLRSVFLYKMTMDFDDPIASAAPATEDLVSCLKACDKDSIL